jgi:hypothetical protein
MRMVHTGLPPKTLNSMRGSLSISPSLLAAQLPMHSTAFFASSKKHSTAVAGALSAAQPSSGGVTAANAFAGGLPSPTAAAGLSPLVLHSRSTVSSAAHGSGKLAHSPRGSVKTPHKATAAAAATKKRITFDVPEDAEDEEREVAEEEAAHHDQVELAGKAAAAKGLQETPLQAAAGSAALITPTNTLVEGVPDVPENAAAVVLTAAADKLADAAAAAADLKDVITGKAASGKKAGAGSGVRFADSDDQQQHDQEEAVAWATVVEKHDGGYAGEAGAAAAAPRTPAAHDEDSPFQAHQADDYSPFQVRDRRW